MPKMLKIEPDKCTGCIQCELACSWVQTGTFQPSASLIKVHIFDEQARYTPYTCFQCKEAWCLTACPVNAIAINPQTGAKVVLDQTCVGCSLCTIACPFGTVFLKPAEHKATKCDLCGGDPACAMACPTDCITYADVPDSAGASSAWMGLLANQVSKAYHEAFAN
jgi:Fe-S-cluster-containing hydrogenase component 2